MTEAGSRSGFSGAMGSSGRIDGRANTAFSGLIPVRSHWNIAFTTRLQQTILGCLLAFIIVFSSLKRVVPSPAEMITD